MQCCVLHMKHILLCSIFFGDFLIYCLKPWAFDVHVYFFTSNYVILMNLWLAIWLKANYFCEWTIFKMYSNLYTISSKQAITFTRILLPVSQKSECKLHHLVVARPGTYGGLPYLAPHTASNLHSDYCNWWINSLYWGA